MDIDDGSVDAIACERLGGHQGLVDHEAGREDRNIFTLAQDVCFANLKGLDHVALKNGRGEARKAHVDGAFEISDRHGGGLCFVGVRGADDRHAGDGAHERDVLDALVAAAVLAHGHAGVGAADLHVELGIGDGVADLFIGPSCAEHSKRRAEGNQPHGRQACGDVHHVRLGNAAVEEALGIGGLEMLGHSGAGQVGVQHHHLLIGGAQLYQSLAVGFTGCDFFTHGLSPPIPSKPAGAAPRWGPCRASPPGSP